MIANVVDEWLKCLEEPQSAQLITAVYGLVRPGRLRVENGRDFVVPIPIRENEFKEADTLDDGLLLNSEHRAVVFVEGDQTRPVKRGNQTQQLLPVRVILWANTELFQPVEGNRVLSALTPMLIAYLERGRPGPFPGGQNIAFNHTNIVEGWKAFQKYTFREETGFLMKPYESVAIDGELTFYLNGKANCNKIDLRPSAAIGDC